MTRIELINGTVLNVDCSKSKIKYDLEDERGFIYVKVENTDTAINNNNKTIKGNGTFNDIIINKSSIAYLY